MTLNNKDMRAISPFLYKYGNIIMPGALYLITRDLS